MTTRHTSITFFCHFVNVSFCLFIFNILRNLKSSDMNVLRLLHVWLSHLLVSAWFKDRSIPLICIKSSFSIQPEILCPVTKATKTSKSDFSCFVLGENYIKTLVINEWLFQIKTYTVNSSQSSNIYYPISDFLHELLTSRANAFSHTHTHTLPR